MSSFWCLCCNRPLSVHESIARGLGPICFAREAAIVESNEFGDKVDIPFNSETMDIICRRDENGLHFNIYQVFRHHSPSGLEYGYLGSGPADFALNIAALFTNHLNEPRTVTLWDKKKISLTAWQLHQRLKEKFIATLPKEGGTIKGDAIRQWVKSEIAASKLAFA